MYGATPSQDQHRTQRRAIRAGSFGLIQQFGIGVDNIDLDAAADEGVWIANMPGLNAVPVAEHAVALDRLLECVADVDSCAAIARSSGC